MSNDTPCRVSADTRNHYADMNNHPVIGAKELDIAREDLVWRLHNGKTVGGLNLRDLIDSDLCGPRAEFASIELTNLVLADSGERAALADRYVDGVIERYLTTNDSLVQEHAEEMAADDGR